MSSRKSSSATRKTLYFSAVIVDENGLELILAPGSGISLQVLAARVIQNGEVLSMTCRILPSVKSSPDQS